MPAPEFNVFFEPLNNLIEQLDPINDQLEQILNAETSKDALLPKESILDLVKQNIQLSKDKIEKSMIELQGQLEMGFGERNPVFLKIVNEVELDSYQKFTFVKWSRALEKLDSGEIESVQENLSKLEMIYRIMLTRLKFIEMAYLQFRESRHITPQTAETLKKFHEDKKITEQEVTAFFKKPFEYKATNEFKTLYDIVAQLPKKELLNIIAQHFSADKLIPYEKPTGNFDMLLEGNKERLVNLINEYKSQDLTPKKTI